MKVPKYFYEKNYFSSRESLTLNKNNTENNNKDNNNKLYINYNVNNEHNKASNNNFYCLTTDDPSIEFNNYSNFNLTNKLIYSKNKLNKEIKNSNTNKINNYKKINILLRGNTIDYSDIKICNNKENKNFFSKYYIYNNYLKKNRTGKQINIYPDNYKSKILENKNRSLAYLNVNNKINYSTERNNELLNLTNNKNKYKIKKEKKEKKEKKIYKINLKFNKFKDNNINKIQDKKQCNIYYNNLLNKSYKSGNNEKEDIINNNTDKNDEAMSKELFSLLVKKLNKALEENDHDKKLIKKLKEENLKLNEKIKSDNKYNEIALNQKSKEINEIQKNKDILIRENEKLKIDIMKLKMEFNNKYYSNLNNGIRNKQKDENELSKLDSICSLIGGLNEINNDKEKDLIIVNKNKDL